MPPTKKPAKPPLRPARVEHISLLLSAARARRTLASLDALFDAFGQGQLDSAYGPELHLLRVQLRGMVLGVKHGKRTRPMPPPVKPMRAPKDKPNGGR